MDVECRIGHPSSLKKRTSSDVSMLVAELLLEKDQAVLLDLSEGLSLASSARPGVCLVPIPPGSLYAAYIQLRALARASL
jgi:hypothetical protein